jgi:hypothetical protein
MKIEARNQGCYDIIGALLLLFGQVINGYGDRFKDEVLVNAFTHFI